MTHNVGELHVSEMTLNLSKPPLPAVSINCHGKRHCLKNGGPRELLYKLTAIRFGWTHSQKGHFHRTTQKTSGMATFVVCNSNGEQGMGTARGSTNMTVLSANLLARNIRRYRPYHKEQSTVLACILTLTGMLSSRPRKYQEHSESRDRMKSERPPSCCSARIGARLAPNAQAVSGISCWRLTPDASMPR